MTRLGGFVRLLSWRAAIGLLPLLMVIPAVSAQQRQVPGAFRGRVVLVPVDVRVLDRDGNPVTDLTQNDFSVLEDGVPQVIGHFSGQAFTAMAPGPDALPALRRGPGLEATPVTHRTFLIVLGRGRLQEPSDGLDAILDLVRHRLLPQDQVGVLAFNRAYGLTTDRAGVLRLLEGFRDRHEAIEARLDHWFSGLTALFGSREAPPGLQREIDGMFAAAGVEGLRELAIGSYGDDVLDTFREVMVGRLLDPDIRPEDREGSFDPVFSPREGYDDIRNLFAGVEFLRYLEGEKHVVFLSEHGLALPGRVQSSSGGGFFGVEAARQYDDFASLAADARVAISTIQTGGVHPRATDVFAPMLTGFTFAARDNRAVSERTGGLASFHDHAARAVDRLDRATRFQYLIGYYPGDPDWDGRFREIQVRVNRPGVTVHHRHGYFGRDELVPFDRRAFMSHSRVMAAATDYRPMRDIGVTLSEPRLAGAAPGGVLEVDVRIDARALAFAEVAGARVAALHVAVFVGNRGQDLLGEQWDVLDLRLDAASFERLQRDNISHHVRVPFAGAPRHIKAVVYDYRGDRLGTAERRVQ